MGYYSEIAIAVKSEDYYKYFNGVEKLKTLLSYAVIKESKKHNVVIIHFDSIKWYRLDFEDIQLVEDILIQISKEERPYSFVRIGEEYDDIETRDYEGADGEFLNEYIYPVRYISIAADESFE